MRIKGLQLSITRFGLSTAWGVWHHASSNQSTTRRGFSLLKPKSLARPGYVPTSSILTPRSASKASRAWAILVRNSGWCSSR